MRELKNLKLYAGFGAAALVLTAGGFWLGVYLGYNNQPAILRLTGIAGKEPVAVSPKVDFSPFWKAWAVLNDNFVNNSTTTPDATDQEKVWGAIAGLANSYGDSYTVFMPPAEKTSFDENISGNFGGVGMEVGLRDGVATVVAPLPDSPAQRAGILTGDIIAKVGATSTASLGLDQVIGYIRGIKGTTVHLTLIRAKVGKPLEVDIVRDTIQIPTIDTKQVNGVFVISLYNFSATAPNLFRNALEKFLQSNSDKLVIDLRGNPGGYLEAATDIASWFLPAGKVIAREQRGSNQPENIYQSKGYDIFNRLGRKVKLVVLVNQGSASASEILAGALSQNGVATLVGEKTFGKGSVQELISVTNNSSLKVTVARWLTPDGTSISHSGIKPDVVVTMTADDVAKGRDPQLDKAVQILNF